MKKKYLEKNVIIALGESRPRYLDPDLKYWAHHISILSIIWNLGTYENGYFYFELFVLLLTTHAKRLCITKLKITKSFEKLVQFGNTAQAAPPIRNYIKKQCDLISSFIVNRSKSRDYKRD